MTQVTVFHFDPENRNDMHTCGFECGIIWASMTHGMRFEYTVHTNNQGQMERIAAYFGYICEFIPDKVEGYALMRCAPMDFTGIFTNPENTKPNEQN